MVNPGPIEWWVWGDPIPNQERIKKMKKIIAVSLMVLIALASFNVQAETFNEQNVVVSATVTNGQTIKLSAPEMRLTPVGEADGASCTLVVGRPYTLDGLILISVDHAATNSITLTDATTTLNLGGANRVVKPGQSILLKAVGTNACNMVAGSFFSTAGTVAITPARAAVTATAVVTAQTAKGYISDVAVTNAAGAEMLFVTNATVAVTIVNGELVMTNATGTVTFTVP